MPKKDDTLEELKKAYMRGLAAENQDPEALDDYLFQRSLGNAIDGRKPRRAPELNPDGSVKNAKK